MSLKDKILSDVLTTLVVGVGLQIRGLLLIPLIAYKLGGEAYGAYVQIVVIATIFSNIFGLGLHSSLVNRTQIYEDGSKLSGLYWLVLFMMTAGGVVGSGILYMFAGPISRLTLNSSTYVRAFETGSVLVLLFSLINLSKNFFRSQMRVKLFTIVNGIQQYLTIIFIAVTIFILDGGFLFVVVSVVVSKLTSVVVLQAIIIRRVGISKPFGDITALLRYGGSFMSTVIMSQFLNDIDKLIIGGFLGPEAVGLYSASYRVASAIRMFMKAITSTFFAEFNRLWNEADYTQIQDLLEGGIRYLLMFGIPSVAGIYLIGPSIVSIIFNPETNTDVDSILVAVSAGVLLYSLAAIYSQVFYASSETSVLVRITTISVVVNVAANFWLIPQIGILGAAIATIIAYSIMLLSTILKLPEELEADLPHSFVIKSLVSSLVFIAIFDIITTPNPVIILVLSPLVYFCSLYLLRGFERHEIKSLCKIVSN